MFVLQLDKNNEKTWQPMVWHDSGWMNRLCSSDCSRQSEWLYLETNNKHLLYRMSYHFHYHRLLLLSNLSFSQCDGVTAEPVVLLIFLTPTASLYGTDLWPCLHRTLEADRNVRILTSHFKLSAPYQKRKRFLISSLVGDEKCTQNCKHELREEIDFGN
jgi:hypothetical protein